MGKKQRVKIGHQVFNSKTAAITYCRQILHGHLNFDTIEGEYHRFLVDLLAKHPESEQKIGCGIKRFFIAADGFGGRCFRVERLDNTDIDFSFRACINQEGPSLTDMFSKACRYAIRGQIFSFKDKVLTRLAMDGSINCAITGQPIYDEKHIHIDHFPTSFSNLIDMFLTLLSMEGLSPTASWFDSDERGTATVFSDNAIGQKIYTRFCEFHYAHVIRTKGLHVVDATAHLRASNTGSKRKKGNIHIV